MPLKSLGEALRALADAVEPVEMRERVLAASVRLRNRRVYALVAWGAVVAAAVVVAFASGCGAGWDWRF